MLHDKPQKPSPRRRTATALVKNFAVSSSVWKQTIPTENCDIVISISPKLSNAACDWLVGVLERAPGVLIGRYHDEKSGFRAFFVTANHDCLLRGAELSCVQKAVKASYGGGRTAFSQDSQHIYEDVEDLETFFTVEERQRILHDVVENVRACDGEGVENVRLYDGESIDKICSYFGVKIALYFSYLGHYTTALTVPALVGCCVWFYSHHQWTHDVCFVGFALFNILWATLYLVSWKRRSSELTSHWNTVDGTDELLLEPRPTFTGVLTRNEVTGLQEHYYPAWKRGLFRYFVSLPVISACLLIAFLIMLQIYHLQDHLKTYQLARFIPIILLAVTIPVLDSMYKVVAHWLNDMENYRLEETYSNHLIIKLVLFQFVNSFLSLFYAAFYLRDMTRLRELLATILITRQLIGNVNESLRPYLAWKWSLLRVGYSMTSELEENEGHGRRSSTEMALTQGEVESRMSQYEDTFDDYLEMVIQFGYVILFSSAFPLAALCALINNIVEIRSDAFKLCYTLQRPFGQQVQNIGSWQTALDVLVLAAVVVNCGLVYVFGHVQRMLPNNSDLYTTIAVIVFVEHVIIAAQYLLSYTIPDTPQWIKILRAKQDYTRRQAVKKLTSQQRIEESAKDGDVENDTPPTEISTTQAENFQSPGEISVADSETITDPHEGDSLLTDSVILDDNYQNSILCIDDSHVGQEENSISSMENPTGSQLENSQSVGKINVNDHIRSCFKNDHDLDLTDKVATSPKKKHYTPCRVDYLNRLKTVKSGFQSRSLDTVEFGANLSEINSNKQSQDAQGRFGDGDSYRNECFQNLQFRSKSISTVPQGENETFSDIAREDRQKSDGDDELEVRELQRNVHDLHGVHDLRGITDLDNVGEFCKLHATNNDDYASKKQAVSNLGDNDVIKCDNLATRDLSKPTKTMLDPSFLPSNVTDEVVDNINLSTDGADCPVDNLVSLTENICTDGADFLSGSKDGLIDNLDCPMTSVSCTDGENCPPSIEQFTPTERVDLPPENPYCPTGKGCPIQNLDCAPNITDLVDLPILNVDIPKDSSCSTVNLDPSTDFHTEMASHTHYIGYTSDDVIYPIADKSCSETVGSYSASVGVDSSMVPQSVDSSIITQAVDCSMPSVVTQAVDCSMPSMVTQAVDCSMPSVVTQTVDCSMPSVVTQAVDCSMPSMVTQAVDCSMPSVVTQAVDCSMPSMVTQAVDCSMPSMVTQAVDCSMPSVVTQAVDCSMPSMVTQAVDCSMPSMVTQAVDCSMPSVVTQAVDCSMPSVVTKGVDYDYSTDSTEGVEYCSDDASCSTDSVRSYSVEDINYPVESGSRSLGNVTQRLEGGPVATGDVTRRLEGGPVATGDITQRLEDGPVATGDVTQRLEDGPVATGVVGILTGSTTDHIIESTERVHEPDIICEPIASVSGNTDHNISSKALVSGHIIHRELSNKPPMSPIKRQSRETEV